MIRFRDVHKAFGSKVVLDGFTLELPEGHTSVLLGYSGSGKSVILKHIVGLLEPDAGEVRVDDQVVHELSRDELARLRGRIGYVFQFAALLDSMTVYDNVALGLRTRGFDPAEVEHRVADSLARVGLPDAGPRFPAELSGGMRKRVGIARAVALRPDYILYDEPTTGLDPVTSAVIDELMVRNRDELGVTGLVVTHDLRSAFRVGDRVAMLYEGRVRQAGTVEEIRRSDDPVVRQFIEGRP
jgi:phospholipid/cholesterol/gamma-HCH transport system ATP-binding protein